jgi:exonuclease III
LNIRSFKAKTEQLEILFTDSNLDILCLSETWLTTSSPVASSTMPGYNVFRKDRNKEMGGGLLMYVKDDIKCKQIDLACANDMECIAITITLSQQM